MLPQIVRYGFLGPVHWAVVEACDMTAGGGIVLTSRWALRRLSATRRKVLIELNHRHPPTLLGMHDIYEPADPPHRREIPIYALRTASVRRWSTVDPAQNRGRGGNRPRR